MGATAQRWLAIELSHGRTGARSHARPIQEELTAVDLAVVQNHSRPVLLKLIEEAAARRQKMELQQ